MDQACQQNGVALGNALSNGRLGNYWEATAGSTRPSRRYADAYAADGRRGVYVGVYYNPAVRTFDDVRTEEAVVGGA